MTLEEARIQMRAWWIAKILQIIVEVKEQEQKRQDKVRKQYLKKLGDYKTYNDLQDAYGCGVITEKQYDRLADILEKSDPNPDIVYLEKINLLEEIYREQKQIYSEQLSHVTNVIE